MNDKIKIDKSFLMRVLEQVDALTKRIEKLESSDGRYEDFKMMADRYNRETVEALKKVNPNLNISAVPYRPIQ